MEMHLDGTKKGHEERFLNTYQLVYFDNKLIVFVKVENNIYY